MQERDRLFLSKFSIDPEMEGDLDTYDTKDFKLGLDIYTDLDDIEIDLIDEDSWGDY